MLKGDMVAATDGNRSGSMSSAQCIQRDDHGRRVEGRSGGLEVPGWKIGRWISSLLYGDPTGSCHDWCKLGVWECGIPPATAPMG